MDNFAPLLRPRAKRSPILIGLGVACLAASIGLGWQTRVLQQQQAAQALAEAKRQAAHQSARPVLSPQAQQAAATIRAELTYPWPTLLLAVERTANKDIELLGFSPDKKAGTVALRGEARTPEALVAYVGELAKQPGLSRVHLVVQQTVIREQLQTVEFEIRARVAATP